MPKTQRTVMVDGHAIEYKLLKRRGQRNFALSVHAGGRVTLTVPKWISIRRAERFMLEKSDWIKDSVLKMPNATNDTKIKRSDYKKHKEKARAFVLSRLVELNKYYEFTYNRISIKVNTSRWGSCSELGNLNFDYRVLFLEPSLQDYLLVHELCHLKEMNHSRAFWALVGETIPDYKVRRRELRKLNL